MPRYKIIFIVGPTAVGKTGVACLLARKLKTEIVSCDAMQVYKELSVLTAKPSKKDLKDIKHHLINSASVKDRFDVSLFRQKALGAIKRIQKKGKIPIVVGGSGLYMSILLDGIFEGKQGVASLQIRKKIERAIQQKGNEWGYKEAKKIDPKAAEKIHPNDVRRTARILEVYEIYKKPISQLHRKRQGLWEECDVRIFFLDMDRKKLYERINGRAEKMFEDGVVDEVKKLRKKFLSQTAKYIIGIKEIQLFLKGELDETQAKELIKRNTRRFAKRQLTWFRKDKRLKWVNVTTKESPLKVSQKILKQIGNFTKDHV